MKTEYWFVLKSKSLSCCALENHGMIHFTLKLKGLKFRLMKESGDLNSNNQKIILFKPNGENVHNGTAPHKYKELKLSSKKSSEIRSWRKSLSLMIVSIFPHVFLQNNYPWILYSHLNKHRNLTSPIDWIHSKKTSMMGMKKFPPICASLKKRFAIWYRKR